MKVNSDECILANGAWLSICILIPWRYASSLSLSTSVIALFLGVCISPRSFPSFCLVPSWTLGIQEAKYLLLSVEHTKNLLKAWARHMVTFVLVSGSNLAKGRSSMMAQPLEMSHRSGAEVLYLGVWLCTPSLVCWLKLNKEESCISPTYLECTHNSHRT